MFINENIKKKTKNWMPQLVILDENVSKTMLHKFIILHVYKTDNKYVGNVILIFYMV